MFRDQKPTKHLKKQEIFNDQSFYVQFYTF